MDIRPYVDDDLSSFVELFTASVHVLGAQFYNSEQLHVWAPRSPDLEQWRKRLSSVHVYVAHEDNELVGFISYEENGHIDLLYVHPAFQRRDVATRLLQTVENILPDVELFTEASLIAKPFFLHHGFHIVEEQNVLFHGVTFRRYAMRRTVVDHSRIA